MSVEAQPRQPKGVKTGGQFDAFGHSEASLTLSPEAPLVTAANYEASVEKALSAASAYEAGDELLMEDHEFDRLMADIDTYEKANGIEPGHDLHSSVGHGGATGGDVEHVTPMLSLDKPGEDAVIEFAEKHPNAVIEPKIDGLALSVQYKNGQLHRAARRGDGYTGEDVTDRVRGVEGLPESAGSGDYEVRGELYLSDQNLVKANEVRASSGKAPFANARNGVAGMLNKQDGSYAGLFSFAAYSTTMNEDADHTEAMDELSDLGFTTARSLLPESVLEAEDPMAAIHALGTERAGIGFLMDGAVLKVNTAAERAALGEGSRAPKWAVAYKYAAVEARSKIEDIELNIGKTGRLSLRARITPVEVDGSVVEYASLHNVGWLKDSGITVGSEVTVFRANDVIPQVKLPAGETPNPELEPWTAPDTCPKCGEAFDKSTELWRCLSLDCSVSGRVQYAVSRDAGLDIEGVGGAIGDALIEAELVKDVSDLFYLEQDQLANLDLGNGRTLGEKNAAKIMSQIEKAKSQPLNRVITSLSMRFTGRTFGRRLAAEFGTMEKLRAARVDQLAAVEGIGENKARAIYDGLKANATVIDRMAAAGVNMGGAAAGGSTMLAGETVVATGAFVVPSLGKLSRGQVQELIEKHGGKASNTVSKATTLLVCAKAGSDKYDKAVELGIPIMSPADFVSKKLGM